MSQYVLQLNPASPKAWMLGVVWPGYWGGLGYVEKPKHAVRFGCREHAEAAMSWNPLGLNGCMKVVKLKKS